MHVVLAAMELEAEENILWGVTRVSTLEALRVHNAHKYYSTGSAANFRKAISWSLIRKARCSTVLRRLRRTSAQVRPTRFV